MIVGTDFMLNGKYRVQSWRRPVPSRLTGRWIMRADHEPSNATINAQLTAHPWWRGNALVSIQPAAIHEHSGAFTEPDILYKHSNFEPAKGSPDMATNIIDVRKAAANWRRRIPLMIDLLGEKSFREIAALVGEIEQVAVDEYVFHEAGHCLGYSTDQKYSDGYFRLGGATRWPLIYVEELRADLLAFGLAAASISPPRAAALFLYNLLLRVGADIEAGADEPRPYGPIPTLLTSTLCKSGWLDVAQTGSLQIGSLRPNEIVAAMIACGTRAIDELVAPEAEIDDPLEAALIAARWLKIEASIRA